MSTFTRKNAWNQGGTFNNSDLLWYAKGVGVMQSRALNDPNSWWFYAAIHGQYITTEQKKFPGWKYITPPPKVPVTPLPSSSLQKQYWNQCQHQSWYFVPWHRGYLIALEQQIRSAVISLGGPKDWALPYWNYFGPNNEYVMPPAFAQQAMLDGSPNPLFVTARYGPNDDGNIYVPPSEVSQDCQKNTIYTGSNSSTKLPGYGGPHTGFSHNGGTSGNLESDPHNQVHVSVGGYKSSTDFGLMSNPGTAALDPVFYLHHCNIDRMWASWNAAGNSNPASTDWLNGPAAVGERKFVMPLPPLGTAWVYTPKDVDSLSKTDYDYDDLSTATTLPLVSKLTQRLNKLGASSVTDNINTKQEANMDTGGNLELVGANKETLQINSFGARTTVQFDSDARKKVSMSLTKASISNLPDHVYLQIESVKGDMDANSLIIIVNQKRVGSVSLFGLSNASMKDGQHGGGGLTFLLDITDIIDNLHLDNALNDESLDILILPKKKVPDDEKITVGRVSIYREGQL